MKKCKWRGYSDVAGGETFCECEAYFRGISCEFQEFDYNRDGSINIVKCGFLTQGE